MGAESLTERAVLLADDVRLDFLEEAREELAGRTPRRWALIAIAFVAGAAATAAGIAFILRRATKPSEAPENGAAESPTPAPTSQSRSWQRWAGNARAGLSTAWNRPSGP